MTIVYEVFRVTKWYYVTRPTATMPLRDRCENGLETTSLQLRSGVYVCACVRVTETERERESIDVSICMFALFSTFISHPPVNLASIHRKLKRSAFSRLVTHFITLTSANTVRQRK
jgi:hypothetical protein